MMGNISDTLILVIIAILLLAGEKDVVSTARNIGKTIEEFRRRQNEFKNELLRELDETTDVHRSIVKDMTYDDNYEYVRSPPQTSNEKIKELEEQINKLKSEVERLKKGNGKN